MENEDLNEVDYTELILSVHVRSSSGNVALSIIKGFKSRYYPDGNSALAWENLSNKFYPVSSHSLFKTESAFRQRKLEKAEDPKIWITNLE
jgi:hypothetical protein